MHANNDKHIHFGACTTERASCEHFPDTNNDDIAFLCFVSLSFSFSFFMEFSNHLYTFRSTLGCVALHLVCVCAVAR